MLTVVFELGWSGELSIRRRGQQGIKIFSSYSLAWQSGQTGVLEQQSLGFAQLYQSLLEAVGATISDFAVQFVVKVVVALVVVNTLVV